MSDMEIKQLLHLAELSLKSGSSSPTVRFTTKNFQMTDAQSAFGKWRTWQSETNKCGCLYISIVSLSLSIYIYAYTFTVIICMAYILYLKTQKKQANNQNATKTKNGGEIGLRVGGRLWTHWFKYTHRHCLQNQMQNALSLLTPLLQALCHTP